MLVKDMGILNTGQYITVPNVLKNMNEYRKIDLISLPSVICVVRE